MTSAPPCLGKQWAREELIPRNLSGARFPGFDWRKYRYSHFHPEKTSSRCFHEIVANNDPSPMRSMFPNTGDRLGVINHTFYGPKTAINDRTGQEEKGKITTQSGGITHQNIWISFQVTFHCFWHIDQFQWPGRKT